MFAQLFGHDLLQQGLLTADELRGAWEAQKNTRVKLGVLALNQGWMTPDQVEEVHHEQAHRDMRFGEIAVMAGYLTEDQVKELLSSQKREHLVLGQTLIDQGLFTYESFSASLERYKENHHLSDEEFSTILQGDMNALVTSLVLNEDDALKAWLADYIALVGKNLIRFIDTQIRMEMVDGLPDGEPGYYVTQGIHASGSPDLGWTALYGSEASLLRFASRYAQEEILEVGELMEASVGEFMNVHNGIYLVNLSNRGVELELSPQVIAREKPETLSDAAVVRVNGSDFELYVLVSDLSKLL